MNGSHTQPVRDRHGHFIRVGDEVDAWTQKGLRAGRIFLGTGVLAQLRGEGEDAEALVHPYGSETPVWTSCKLVARPAPPVSILEGVM